MRQAARGRQIEVEPGTTSGDFLQGFLRGTRKALHENGRENLTLSIPEVSAFTLGAIIATFERAVSFYASLVHVNAYHQPGVEAGKKAAGAFLKAQKRHNMRPAHLHFMVYKPGFKTIASQVYVQDDPYLETDSQFGVTKALIGDYRKQPDGSYALAFTFTIEPGEARRPKAPITAKVATR